MKKGRCLRVGAVALMVVSLGAPGVFGANYYWDAGGVADTDWSNTNNWTAGNIKPTASDTAYLTSGDSTQAIVTITQDGEVCNNWYANDALGRDCTVTMDSGSLEVGANLYLPNYATRGSSFTLNGGRLRTASWAAIGTGAGGLGTFVQNAGSVTNNGLYLGYVNIGSTGVYNHLGGNLNVLVGSFSVGNQGVGAYTMGPGANLYCSGKFYCGNNAGAVGTVVMSNATATFVNDTAVGGSSGTGYFFQYGGTNRVEGSGISFVIGGDWNNFLGTGTYSLVGGGLLATSNRINVGRGVGTFYQGPGTIVSNSGSTDAGKLMVGSGTGGSGTYTNDGGLLYLGGYLQVGYSANSRGTFIQTAGSTVVINNFAAGQAVGGRGTVEINGGTLAYSGANGIYLGSNGGTGTLAIAEGGVVTNAGGGGTVYLGEGADNSDGTVNLQGGTLYADGVNVRVQVNSRGAIRGWGAVRNSGTFTMSGRIEADGYGTDRTLAITNYSTFSQSYTNSTSGTNGWYAINHGRLLLKSQAAAATMYWGEQNGPDLVNAVKLQLAGQSGTLTGVLYAADNGDVPAYARSAKITAIWRFSGVTVSDADLTVRYDHARAAELGVAESNLKAYTHAGGASNAWTQVAEYGIDTNANTIAASNLTSLAFFAVGEGIPLPPPGTTIVFR